MEPHGRRRDVAVIWGSLGQLGEEGTGRELGQRTHTWRTTAWCVLCIQ